MSEGWCGREDVNLHDLVALQLTTKNEVTRLVASAKTLAVAHVKTTAELDALVKTLREHLPATVMVVKYRATNRRHASGLRPHDDSAWR